MPTLESVGQNERRRKSYSFSQALSQIAQPHKEGFSPPLCLAARIIIIGEKRGGKKKMKRESAWANAQPTSLGSARELRDLRTWRVTFFPYFFFSLSCICVFCPVLSYCSMKRRREPISHIFLHFWPEYCKTIIFGKKRKGTSSIHFRPVRCSTKTIKKRKAKFIKFLFRLFVRVRRTYIVSFPVYFNEKTWASNQGSAESWEHRRQSRKRQTIESLCVGKNLWPVYSVISTAFDKKQIQIQK